MYNICVPGGMIYFMDNYFGFKNHNQDVLDRMRRLATSFDAKKLGDIFVESVDKLLDTLEEYETVELAVEHLPWNLKLYEEFTPSFNDMGNILNWIVFQAENAQAPPRFVQEDLGSAVFKCGNDGLPPELDVPALLSELDTL